MMTANVATILLVEDSQGDVDLVREALAENKMCNKLFVAGDGVEAMAFLRREGDFASAPRPDIILLDWNLPKKDGREVLAEIKGDEQLRTIPVVVLTTSREDKDVLKAYDLHANCYVTKPVKIDQFLEIINSIDMFWFGMVSLPKQC